MYSAALIAIASGIALLTGVAEFAAQDRDESPNLKPLVVLTGANSQIAKPDLQLIKTPEDWKRVWGAHQDAKVDNVHVIAPEIDFDRCMVVAIFRGERVNVSGARIDSTFRTGNSICIRLHDISYQTGGKRGEVNEKPPAHPFAFVVLEKTELSIVVEENVQSIINQPAEWKEWGRTDGRKTTISK